MPKQLPVLVALDLIRDALVIQRYRYLTEVKPNLTAGFMVKPLVGIVESSFTFMINNLTILYEFLK